MLQYQEDVLVDNPGVDERNYSFDRYGKLIESLAAVDDPLNADSMLQRMHLLPAGKYVSMLLRLEFSWEEIPFSSPRVVASGSSKPYALFRKGALVVVLMPYGSFLTRHESEAYLRKTGVIDCPQIGYE